MMDTTPQLLDMDWCAIPAGQVVLKKGGYIPQDQTPFQVAAFSMARYPVTRSQWGVFLAAPDGYQDPAWWDYSPSATAWHSKHGPLASIYKGDRLPITDVSWYEAVAFCRWFSATVGETITLPTEQQWQWAAQGPDARLYPWGADEITPQHANIYYSVGKPTPVDGYLLNQSPFGVRDLAGNVWEWCCTDWLVGNDDVSAPGPKLNKGGCWTVKTPHAHTTYRNWVAPSVRGPDMGFRIVRM